MVGQYTCLLGRWVAVNSFGNTVFMFYGCVCVCVGSVIGVVVVVILEVDRWMVGIWVFLMILVVAK